MFGFGKRKAYNAFIDTKLTHDFQIRTLDDSRFPGVLAYLKLIDRAWAARMTENEGALYVAILFYEGLLSHGEYDEEAARLLKRIAADAESGLAEKKVTKARWVQFSAFIETANAKAKR